MKFLHFLKKQAHTHVVFIIIVTLFLFILFSILATFRWMQTEYMGIVISLDESSFTIANPQNETHTFLLTQETQIYKGRKKEPHIEIGNTILVVCSNDSHGTMTARMIRILKPPKGAEPSQQSIHTPETEM